MNPVQAQLEAELEALQDRIQPILVEYQHKNQILRDLKASEFIKVHQITKKDVEMSTGDNLPWFETVDKFIAHVKQHGTTKRFMEWNTVIYFTQDLLDGRMPAMPATTAYLKG